MMLQVYLVVKMHIKGEVVTLQAPYETVGSARLNLPISQPTPSHRLRMDFATYAGNPSLIGRVL